MPRYLKDRTQLFEDKILQITENTVRQIIQWLNQNSLDKPAKTQHAAPELNGI